MKSEANLTISKDKVKSSKPKITKLNQYRIQFFFGIAVYILAGHLYHMHGWFASAALIVTGIIFQTMAVGGMQQYA